MKVSLSNFRCFARTSDIEIRPITLIVGENSSGKTSLMAALRFAFELSQSSATSFFNVYPFDLGPYDDIVHESGVIGASERFSIEVEKYVDLGGARSFPHTDKSDNRDFLVRCAFFFKSNYGDTVLSSVRLSTEGDQMDIRFDEGIRITILEGNNRTSFDEDALFPDAANPSINLLNSLYLLMGLRYGPASDGLSEREKKQIGKFAGLYDAFLSDNHRVTATPPVRSVPRKVYTGSDQETASGGEAAPYKLSKIKRSDKTRWSALNKELNRLGRNAGLFNKIDVKKLTNQDSGPFQLKVTVRGRATPIADVGYGVSQSLPIFSDLIANKSTKSAMLLQQPEVHLHPQAQAELGTIFAEFVNTNSKAFLVTETHSDHLVDRIRIEIKEKRLSPSLVNLVFLCPNDSDVDVHQIKLDSQGNLVDAPAQYREFFIREQERVLGF